MSQTSSVRSAPVNQLNRDSVGQRILSLATDGLALARGQGAEEVVEGAISAILPVELLVRSAVRKFCVSSTSHSAFGQKGDVDRRGAGLFADAHQSVAGGGADGISMRARAGPAAAARSPE